MNLEGTKTQANLMAAFAGESEARNKYTYYASKAKKDGFVQISQLFTETANNAHHVRRRDDAVEVHEAFLDLRDQVIRTDHVGACRLGLFRLVTLREHEDAERLPRPVREDDGATDHLVGVTRIDTKTNGEIDSLVELGRCGFFHERARLLQRELLATVHDRSCRCFLFRDFRHCAFLSFGVGQKSPRPPTAPCFTVVNPNLGWAETPCLRPG